MKMGTPSPRLVTTVTSGSLVSEIAGAVHKFVRSRLDPLVKPEIAPNARFSRESFVRNLYFSAVVSDASIHKGAELLRMSESGMTDNPSDDRVLATLAAQDPVRMAERFQLLTDRILVEAKGLAAPLNGPVPVAIDGNNKMYYGKQVPEIIGTKHQRGTNWAYHYEVAQIADNRFPLTLGTQPLMVGVDRWKLLRGLIALAKARVEVSVLLLDRGYYGSEVVRVCREAGLPFIMPLPLNDHTKKAVRELFYSKNTGCFVGKFAIGQRKDRVEVNLVLVENKEFRDTSKPIWERVWAYITTLDVKEEERESVDKQYSWRWRIETGFRTKNGFMVNTTTKKARVRLFLYLFAQALRNLWLLYDLEVRGLRGIDWSTTTRDSKLERMTGVMFRFLSVKALWDGRG